MTNWINDYFYHTKSERIGAIVLLLLCGILIGTSYLLPYLFNHEPTQDFTAFKAEIEAFEKGLAAAEVSNKTAAVENITIELRPFDPNTATREDFISLGLSARVAQTIVNYRSKGGKFRKPADFKKIYGVTEEDFLRLSPYLSIATKPTASKADEYTASLSSEGTSTIELFSFDPNTATVEEFVSLGLSPKVANTIANYRGKGGSFRQKEDLKKIYGLSESDYERLESYILIPTPAEIVKGNNSPSTPTEKRSPVAEKTTEPVIIDINTATVEEWQALKGIGPYYAGRIVKFRDALGGFATVNQVSETYRLPDSTFQSIKPYLQPSPIFEQIQINTATAEELKAHPYLKWKEANIIVKYREQHGKFASIEDLKPIKILTEKKLEQLEPYLRFD